MSIQPRGVLSKQTLQSGSKKITVLDDQEVEKWFQGNFSPQSSQEQLLKEESAIVKEVDNQFEGTTEGSGILDEHEEVGDAEAVGECEGALDVVSFQSPPSSTFSDVADKVSIIAMRSKPSYRSVIKYVKMILSELVNKNTENVLSHFEEWSYRVINNLKNTYGVPQELFLPTAQNYLYTLKSFTFEWKNAVEEYLHEYGPELLGEEGILERIRNDMEGEGEGGIATIDDVIIKDDDWEQGGYKHYLERKAEPKEPPYDEFEYVILEQLAFFDEVGIGLPKAEQYEIHMAMKRLAKVRNLLDVKFWGKIFGLYQDYYIAEAIMKPEDMEIEDFIDLPEYAESDFVGEYCEDLMIDEILGEMRAEDEQEPEEVGDIGREMGEEGAEEAFGEFRGEFGEDQPGKFQKELLAPTVTFDEIPTVEPVELDVELGEEEFGEQESVFELDIDDGRFKGKWTLRNYKLPKLPMIKEKPIKLAPMEKPGEGTNKHVFFVTNDPKSDWIRLPHVTPEQIVVARQIRKFFTGYLTSRVNSWPKFPGIEMNLLRAQIARISAGTQVSPAGYYRFEEGEEGAEPADIATGKGVKIELNKDFEPLTVEDLTDPTCIFWIHHTEHILNQGRTVWFNVNQKERKQFGEGFAEDDDEMEEGPPFEDVAGEVGPPLLTSCSQDLFMEAIPPWTVKPAIELAPHEGVTYIRSNLWPGSYSFAFGRKIGFMYIGWGFKTVTYGYTPPPPPFPAKEYPLGPLIIEITDPTPAQEEEYRLKLEEWLKKQEKPVQQMIEGEGSDAESDDD